jgi:hypothetical protein
MCNSSARSSSSSGVSAASSLVVVVVLSVRAATSARMFGTNTHRSFFAHRCATSVLTRVASVAVETTRNDMQRSASTQSTPHAPPTRGGFSTLLTPSESSVCTSARLGVPTTPLAHLSSVICRVTRLCVHCAQEDGRLRVFGCVAGAV